MFGLPYICPYNVNSIMNPILVMSLGLGYFFNLYRGQPIVRPGGVAIYYHPVRNEFHPVHHPSYIDFFEEVLTETTDPVAIETKYEEQFATDPWYIHLYRNSYAYHGVHPLYMWYWGAHALEHLGDVIFVGGDRHTTSLMGPSRGPPWTTRWKWSRGPGGEQREHHLPARPAADHGRRSESDRKGGAMGLMGGASSSG